MLAEVTRSSSGPSQGHPSPRSAFRSTVRSGMGRLPTPFDEKPVFSEKTGFCGRPRTATPPAITLETRFLQENGFLRTRPAGSVLPLQLQDSFLLHAGG